MNIKEFFKKCVAAFNRMSIKGKIITVAVIVVLGIIGNLLGYGDMEITDPIQQVKTTETVKVPKTVEAPNVAEDPKTVEEPNTVIEPQVIEEPETVDYEIGKNYIENDPSAYSGRRVYEIEIFGEFDLEAESLKVDVEAIIEKESKIALEEQPNSELIRVFVFQGTKEEYEMRPLAARTFDNVDGELKEQPLETKLKFPLLEDIENQK